MSSIEDKKELASHWFATLRDQICAAFESIEAEATSREDNPAFGKNPGHFERTAWNREEDGGGGEMSIMRGSVFEKVGVNISTVHGTFSEKFRGEIPGTEKDARFWASGISLVAHMCSPLVPAVHMNTRFIVTGKHWFGGGADITPMRENAQDTKDFHNALKHTCDQFHESYYPKYSDACNEYFHLKHRNEPRGVGGIFYDYMDSGNWDEDFSFTQEVGKTFLDIYPRIIRRHYDKNWTNEDRAHQLQRRGRYVEFNLLYDRGTRFGLMTGGNVEAILMSLPPVVTWP